MRRKGNGYCERPSASDRREFNVPVRSRYRDEHGNMVTQFTGVLRPIPGTDRSVLVLDDAGATPGHFSD